MPKAANDRDEFDRTVDKANRSFNRFVTYCCVVAFFAGLVAIEYYRDPPQMQKARGLPNIFTDPATGCQYLVERGITPRLMPDGSPLCVQQSES